jgi:hypothetical protein
MISSGSSGHPPKRRPARKIVPSVSRVAHLCEESNSKRSTATNATAVLVAVPCSPPFAFNCFVEPAKNRLPLEPTKNCHFDRSCSRSCEQRSGEIRCTTQHSVPANTAFLPLFLPVLLLSSSKALLLFCLLRPRQAAKSNYFSFLERRSTLRPTQPIA